MIFKDLQSEVARRATRDQGGTQFTAGIKNIINFSLFRIAREKPWRVLRRKSTFDTITSYTTGSGAANVTNGSPNVTVTGATFITDGITIGRKVKFSGSGTFYFITEITGETTLVLDQNFNGTSSATNIYEILPQEEYNLPIQSSHRMFMWHEAFGYPFKMQYITDQEFYQHGAYLSIKYIPTHYRMWGEDMVKTQVRQPSIISISSSSTSDTTIGVTVFGTVSGYPDYEVITTDGSNGTTVVNGSKIFSYVERVVKNNTTVGRITATANSAGDTVAVLPVGAITSGILYKKVQLYALPNQTFPIHVQYYKDPFALVNDGDVHEFGQEFDEAIILLSVFKLKAEQNMQTEADRFAIMWKDEVFSLRKNNCDKIDWLPTLKRPKESGSLGIGTGKLAYAQFGPMYGPSSRY